MVGRHYLWIMLLLGLIIGATNLLAPLHELFHVMAAAREGIGGRITGWSNAQIDSPNFQAQVLAGWSGEMYFYCALSVLFALMGKRFPKLTGAFPLGYMVTTWVRGYGSDDFTGGLHRYVQSFPQYGPGKLSVVESMYYDRLFGFWTILCAVLIGIAVLAVAMRARRKGKPGSKSPRASVAGGSVKV